MQLSSTLYSHLTSMPDIDLWNPQRLFLNDRNDKVLFHFYHIFLLQLFSWYSYRSNKNVPYFVSGEWSMDFDDRK